MPMLGKISRDNGLAGQIQYSVDVTYEGEPTSRVAFVGHPNGGPVVMCTPRDSRGTFVADPERFGVFGPDWVRRFFADPQ